MAGFEEIESSWTLASDGYDNVIQKELTNRRNMRYWSHELAKQLGNKPLRVLEVGCGPGFFTVMLCRLGHHVKAIDGSEGMIANARANVAADGQKAIIEEQDAVTLPNEENESYDVIISRDVVWTLYDPEQAFREANLAPRSAGQIEYQYGIRFVTFLMETYGPDVIQKLGESAAKRSFSEEDNDAIIEVIREATSEDVFEQFGNWVPNGWKKCSDDIIESLKPYGL